MKNILVLLFLGLRISIIISIIFLILLGVGLVMK